VANFGSEERERGTRRAGDVAKWSMFVDEGRQRRIKEIKVVCEGGGGRRVKRGIKNVRGKERGIDGTVVAN
jgi:hypothetical protein